jgi:amidase
MPDDRINAFAPGPRVHIEGRPGGPLSGLTFAAKDLFDVAEHPTGGGNPDWARRTRCRRGMPGPCSGCSTPARF